MAPFSLAALIKFLIGIFLVQGATALLLMTAQEANLNKSGLLFGALGLLIGVITAFWFTSITSHARQHSLIKASEKYQRQRDRIMRQAEKEKTKEIRNSHRQLLRETRHLQSRSTLKLGAALTGVAGLGVLLLFAQFMTLGVLAVSATGGALLCSATASGHASTRHSAGYKIPRPAVYPGSRPARDAHCLARKSQRMMEMDEFKQPWYHFPV